MPKAHKLYLKKKIGRIRRDEISKKKSLDDGVDIMHLTKDQRYYLRHKAEINQKNSERNKRSRAKKRLSDEDCASSQQNNIQIESNSRVEASIQTEDYGLALEDYLLPTDISTERLEEILDGSYQFDPPLLRVPSNPINHMSPYREYDIFVELRKCVRAWGSLWGGVDNWNHSLDIFFAKSQREGYRESHMIVVNMFRVSQKGKCLLGSLDDLHGRLPTDNLAVSLLWRYHDELVKILVKGITTLDCRLDYIHRSLTEGDTLGRLDYKVALEGFTRTHSIYYNLK